MSLRNAALILLAAMVLSAGAVLVPPATGAAGCRAGPHGTGYLCASLGYSGLVAHGFAQRALIAPFSEHDAVFDALTSSPMLGVDFGPARRLAVWWMEQTGKAIMARHSLQ